MIHQKRLGPVTMARLRRKGNFTRPAEIVSQAIIKALRDFPEDMVKMITFDRGKEFAGYEDIENALHFSTCFCNPYCARQKGTNENTNGPITCR